MVTTIFEAVTFLVDSLIFGFMIIRNYASCPKSVNHFPQNTRISADSL